LTAPMHVYGCCAHVQQDAPSQHFPGISLPHICTIMYNPSDMSGLHAGCNGTHLLSSQR
jgi:hypothetical protein